ncbi:MAG TPA: FAD-dependent oxidoreductase [Myxococcales bacterium]|nr:FAD-dependent oxidoreductase [Myxococcales bacterium]HAN31844.1 FAD-dependent oxidoreductase [Myxococcales bacterium]
MTTSTRSEPWSREAPEGKSYDAIVIGSGMGGMTCAALLAKQGKKVLVLEQHYAPGGFTHTFRRRGYLWDVGVHAVGEVTRKSMPGRVLHALTDGKLKWASLGKTYDEFYFPDGKRIDFPDSKQQFRENLVAAFPEEEEAIDRYLELVRTTCKAMGSYYMGRALPRKLGFLAGLLPGHKDPIDFSRTTLQVISELTDNPQLQTVFAAQWGYYGSIPRRSSWVMQALVVKHFWHGGYYPVDGSAAIADHMLQTVADAGGWTLASADVERIDIKGNKATGVTLKDGRSFAAKQIFSAAGVQSTVRRLLPDAVASKPWAEEIKTLRPASAHVCLYIGFKGDIRKAGAGSANKWFYDTWSLDFDTWDVSDRDKMDTADILYCSFPSLKDPNYDPGNEQRHTGEVVTFVPWEVFKPWTDTKWRRRGEQYDALKKKMHDVLLEQFLQRMPELREMVDYSELSTPLSTDKFCRPMRGSIYGLEPTPERFSVDALRPASPIKGLYFAGSEITSVGVIGAMMGGLMAAVAAEPMGTMKFIRGLKRP